MAYAMLVHHTISAKPIDTVLARCYYGITETKTTVEGTNMTQMTLDLEVPAAPVAPAVNVDGKYVVTSVQTGKQQTYSVFLAAKSGKHMMKLGKDAIGFVFTGKNGSGRVVLFGDH